MQQYRIVITLIVKMVLLRPTTNHIAARISIHGAISLNRGEYNENTHPFVDGKLLVIVILAYQIYIFIYIPTYRYYI